SSHKLLLKVMAERRHATARIDGIVVPSARPISFLRNALETAERLSCPLVVLCSQKVTAAEVIDASRDKDVNAIAVDVINHDPGPNPATTQLLAGTQFEMPTDTSVKRNIGVAVSRMSGWESVLFLDDDID